MKIASLLAAALLAFNVHAQTPVKITLGYIPANPEGITAFIAKEQGFFAKHGLDVTMAGVPMMGTLPPALVSGSNQVAAITATTLVQADDSGLDLVAIAGSSSTSKRSMSSYGVVVQNDSTIRTAKDLIGKKVAVPGFGAFMDLMMREWLVQNGVQVKQVNFVEIGLPNLPDVLRTKSVDAIVSFGAQMQRIKTNKLGTPIADFTVQAGEGQSTTLFAATGDWVKKNPAAVKAFKAAAKDAVDFIHANPDKATEILSSYTKLPADDIKAIGGLPAAKAEITIDQIKWWQALMTRQGMIGGKVDPAKMVAQ